MKVDHGSTYTCDYCGKAENGDYLPWGWVRGRFMLIEGHQWDLIIHLCSACWASSKISHKDVPGIFRKLATKFGWCGI